MLEQLTLREDAALQTRDFTTRAITVRAATIDEAQRSVEIALATENPATVYAPGYGVTDEVLRSDGGQYPKQLPLLANHNRYSLDAVLGSVRNIRKDGDIWIGRAFFAENNPAADAAWGLVRQGHLTDVSIGYRSTEGELIPPGQTRTVSGKSYTASATRSLLVTTRYEPKEASMVPVGADKNTKVRGDEGVPLPHSTAGATRKESPMNPLLRKYLESLGLRADANESEAQAFHKAIGGATRAIADDIEGGKITDEAGLKLRTAPPVTAPATPAAAAPAAPVTQQRSEDQIRADERLRVATIRDNARAAEVPAELAGRAETEGWTVERAAGEFLTHLRSSRTPAVGNDAPAGIVANHERDCTRESLGVALFMRSGMDDEKKLEAQIKRMNTERSRRGQQTLRMENVCQQAHRFDDMALLDVCREAIRLDGRQTPQGREEIIRSAISGGSLTQIFTTSVNAMVLAMYEEEPDTTDWVDEGEVADFKTNTDIRFTAKSGLKKLPRGATADHASVDDSAETYKIARYAEQGAIDEQDIIDDSMNALALIPGEFGKDAGRLRPDLVYAMVLNGETATMADTGAVFNGTALTTAGGHANYYADGTTGVGGPLAAGTLQLAITKMRQQYQGSGRNKKPLNIVPVVLLVPPELQFTAEILLTSAQRVTGQDAGTFNPLQGKLRPIVETRVGTVGVTDPDSGTAFTGTAVNYFLFARPGLQAKVVYRRGTGRSPQIRGYTLDKGTWGVGYDVKLDIGCKFTEFRGAFKAKGAA